MSNTQLKDRTLYYDGDSVVEPSHVFDFLDKGINGLCVTELTDEIKQFNRYVSREKRITVKNDVRSLSFDWNIPDNYKTLDVIDYIEGKLDLELEQKFGGKLDGLAATQRTNRIYDELESYQNFGLFPVLRAVIYIINTLREKEIVWGVGRGSSVSSYVLYLIGVHDVDSVKYDLDFTDFLRAT